MSTKTDFTPTGTKIEGAYENDRNAERAELYKAVVREVYGVKDVIVGHHIVYQLEEKGPDGFTYTFTEEVPSADTLLFDHDAAKKIWGEKWQDMLVQLALTPVDKRDAVFEEAYYSRPGKPGRPTATSEQDAAADTLADRLRAAAQAHHVYEKSLGHPDADWAGWYAKWMVEHPTNS